METIILGLGNDLLADEGVGVHACRLLQQRSMPKSTRIVIAGTAILDTISELEQAERIIVVDAMKGEELPGTVYRIPFNQCSGSGCIASMHGFDIFRTIALLERTTQPHITVFGVEPELIAWSLELSETVTKSLPFLLEAILEEIQTQIAPAKT